MSDRRTENAHARSGELRVFISSTFLDLQAEREHLVKTIFPEIRALCRERGIVFTEVDLRWGLTDQDQALGRIIGTCLDEIDRCRPYFIGIIGSRYGHIPSLAEYYKDPGLLARYPWLEDAAMDEASVIDLEFRHGVLNTRGEGLEAVRAGASFYVRRPSGEDRASETWGTEEDRVRLLDLEERVRATGFPIEEFDDPASLGRMIRGWLLEIIERDFASAQPPSLLQQARMVHEAFAASRREAYIPNITYLKRLTEHVAGDGPPLVVYAESGSGKSALLAHWTAEYRRRHPDAFVIEHYIGVGAGPTDHLDVMRHVMMEIGERYVLQKELPTTSESIEEKFPFWLAEVQKERLMLVIDGVNQLQGIALALNWLPKHIPPMVRLVISSTVSQTLAVVRERGWQQMGVQPLNEQEREAMIVRFLAGYRKALSADLVQQVARDPKCAQPLFLRTMLEELRLFGRHEELNLVVERLLGTTGPEDLFQFVLERLEGSYSEKSTRDVLSLIWASRQGLLEEEVSEIAGISRLDLSAMLGSLEYHLVRSEGCLGFFHEYLRRAVAIRYMSDEGRRKRAHLDIARYFEGRPMNGRTAVELPWQLREAGETERLAQAISRLDLLDHYLDRRGLFELLGYWLRCGGVEAMAASYNARLEAEKESDDIPRRVRNLLRVCALYRVSGISRQGQPIGYEALAICESEFGAEDPRTAMALDELASLLQETIDYSEVESLYRRALAIREAAFGAEHAEVAKSLYNLAGAMREAGRYAEGEEIARRSLAIREAVLGTEHPRTLQSLERVGMLLTDQGLYAEADVVNRKVLNAYEAMVGPEHPELLPRLTHRAITSAYLGNNGESEALYRRTLAICRTSMGAEHPETANTMNNLATLLMRTGGYAEAESLLRGSLAIREKVLGADHVATSRSAANLATLLAKAGNYTESEALHRRALEIQKAMLGEEHPTTIWSMNNLAGLLADVGRFVEAQEVLQQVVEVQTNSLGIEHPYTIASLGNLATVMSENGNHAEAEPMFHHAIGLCNTVLGDEHPWVANLWHCLGELCMKQQRLPEAGTYMEQALDIRRRKLGDDHIETATTLSSLGRLRRAEDRHHDARALLRSAIPVFERVYGPEHVKTAEVYRELEALPDTAAHP